MANPIVTIEMENGDIIKAELYPAIAPNTVNNFIFLANMGFYDDTIFHRVISGFMIQGGDPQGIGTGGPGYTIKGEFSRNGFKNELKHEAGVLSMARSMLPNSAGSQFFIMHKNAPHLDGSYAAFGKVIEGMDVVDKIANVEVYYRDTEVDEDYEIPEDEDGNQISSDTPKEQPVITSITVETYGVDYGAPDVVKTFDLNSLFSGLSY